MFTRRILLATGAALSILALAPAPATAADTGFTLLAESNPPLSYTQGGKATGENVKVLTTLFKRAGIPVRFQIESWDKAFDSAKKEERHGVFTAIRTPDRESMFQWVGPISTTRWVFLAKKGN
jgi:polar amino acid transport system substrate-binding protein